MVKRWQLGRSGDFEPTRLIPVDQGTPRTVDGRDSSADLVRERFRELRRTGNGTLREDVILQHGWLARQCARRFRDRGEPEADLVQVAWMGLVKATDRYDPERDVPFHAYAIPTIVGELKRHFRDTTWTVGVPRSTKELMPRLRAATDVLSHRFGRSPSVDEVAEELQVGRDTVVAALAARGANRPSPLEHVHHEPIVASGTAPQGQREHDEVELRVATLGVLEHLDDRSQKILVWRFYEELTQREIGERLGIGQVQVSRLLRSAIEKVRACSIS